MKKMTAARARDIVYSLREERFDVIRGFWPEAKFRDNVAHAESLGVDVPDAIKAPIPTKEANA